MKNNLQQRLVKEGMEKIIPIVITASRDMFLVLRAKRIRLWLSSGLSRVKETRTATTVQKLKRDMLQKWKKTAAMAKEEQIAKTVSFARLLTQILVPGAASGTTGGVCTKGRSSQ